MTAGDAAPGKTPARRKGGVAAALAGGGLGKPPEKPAQSEEERLEREAEEERERLAPPPEPPPAPLPPAPPPQPEPALPPAAPAPQAEAPERRGPGRPKTLEGARRGRSFRASDAEYQAVYDTLDALFTKVPPSIARRIEPSAIVRAALRLARQNPELVLKEIQEHNDFT